MPLTMALLPIVIGFLGNGMNTALHGVCIVATDDCYGMGIMQTKDMFHSASLRLAINTTNENRPTPAFPVIIASPNGNDIKSYSGTSIQTDRMIDNKDHWDLIFICHFWGDATQQLQDNPNLVSWLQEQSRRKTAIIALGSGVLWLAQAGLLDGRDATTYWHYREEFSQCFPRVNWLEQASITQSDHLCCVAGATSANDMLLHHITKLCGAKVAQGINRDILFDSRRTYDLPTSGLEVHRQHDDQQILQVQSWLDSHFNQVVDFNQIAQRFNMSLRNFPRRFERATGSKPLQYLQRLRITIAKERLIYSNNSIKHIALDVGYQDSSYFSALFKRHLALTPAAFRQQYRIR